MYLKKIYVILLVILAASVLACGAGYVMSPRLHNAAGSDSADNAADVLNGPLTGDIPDEARLIEAPASAPAPAGVPFSASSDSSFDSAELTNILLVGRDVYNLENLESRRGNADGIMIVTINNRTKEIVLTSVLRDTFLHIDSHTGTKATLIFNYYGLDELIAAIERNLGISIDNYAVFNYLDVIGIIDAAGGIEAELYPEEIRIMNEKMNQLNSQLLDLPIGDGNLDPDEPGTYNLTGKQAVTYMRVRISDETNNEFGRTARERSVILKLKDKMSQMSVSELYSFGKAFRSGITTDITETRMLSMVLSAADYKEYRFVTGYVPQPDTYRGSEGFLYIDYEKNSKFLRQQMGIED